MKETSYRYTDAEFDPLSEFSTSFRGFAQEILAGRYAEVMDDMSKHPHWQEEVQLTQLQEKYYYLRKYYLSGAEDPTRESFLREIGRDLLRLLRTKCLLEEVATQPYHSRTMADRRLAEHHMCDEAAFISSLQRLGSLINEPEVYYPHLELLFDYTWVGEIGSTGVQALIELLHDDRQTIAARHLLSALYLGLLQNFDGHKLKVIAHVVEDDMTDPLLGTALPILLIIGRRYQQELTAQHPLLVEKIRHLLHTIPQLNDATYKAVMEIYHAYSTTRDHQLFVENVLPKLQELRSHLDFSNSTDIAQQMEALSERLSTEESQELQELMESAAKRMLDFDATGHDVEYHSMKETKSTPFFSSVSNWFLPYDPRHPLIDAEVAKMLDEYSMMIFKGPNNIISSDMYSVATFPQWKEVMAQLSQFKDTFPQPEPTHRSMYLTDYMRDFLFGAYRFHYLSSARMDFYNPFEDKPYVLDGAFTQIPYLFSEEEILGLASFFAKDKHYVAAGSTYERLVAEQGIDTGEVWRGIAVTRMIRKDNEGALYALQKAMDAEGMTIVTVSKAAQILREMGRREEELTLLIKAESKLDGSGVANLIERKSLILREKGEMDQALEAAFKAVYLSDRKSESAIIILGESLLISVRPEDAYRQLNEEDEVITDERKWLMGIARIAMGQRSEGIKMMREVKSTNLATENRLRMLDLLKYYNIQPWEQSLIMDTIRLKENL